jgi:hypothetical protein
LLDGYGVVCILQLSHIHPFFFCNGFGAVAKEKRMDMAELEYAHHTVAVQQQWGFLESHQVTLDE